MAVLSSSSHALIVCDCQEDALSSLSASCRDTLLQNLLIAIDVAQRGGWTVILSGLRFCSGYPNVSHNHRLYGALRRLNDKVGDGNAHWFMEGYSGCDIASELSKVLDANVVTVWRSTHLPPQQLLTELQSRSISKATVVGIKAGYSIQAMVQFLCDQSLEITVIPECISDDDKDRLEAVMNHILPIYAHAMTLADMVDDAVGLLQYQDIVAWSAATEPADDDKKIFSLCDCGRGGHMALYASHLLERSNWCMYPLQNWYTDNSTGREYLCPLGKKLVSFCDEPQFSQISMFIKGRESLDEKEKVLELAKGFMPETYVLDCATWVDKNDVPVVEDTIRGPWFLKECDKNGGRSVQIFQTLAECKDLADAESMYVVQAHIDNPRLTNNGQKCHVKFYSLLTCAKDGVSWQLFTYQDAFLCVSPNQWSGHDLSRDTQVTIKRLKRMRAGEEIEMWKGWPAAYRKCQETVAAVVDRAIGKGKLLGRPEKKQFEIFSADFMMDTSGKIWLIEFNFSPVIFDPLAGQDLTTAGLKEYQRLYETMGDDVEVNDRAMIGEALSIVFSPEQALATRWDPAGSFQGQSPRSIDGVTADGSLLPGLMKTMM